MVRLKDDLTRESIVSLSAKIEIPSEGKRVRSPIFIQKWQLRQVEEVCAWGARVEGEEVDGVLTDSMPYLGGFTSDHCRWLCQN